MKEESKYTRSRIIRTAKDEGESIEEMVRRCLATNEPIESNAPMIYTDKKDGVMPQYNPRTDRFDLALDAIDKYQRSEAAQTQNAVEVDAQTETANGE